MNFKNIPDKYCILSPTDVLPLLSFYTNRSDKYFICISLNNTFEVVTKEIFTFGFNNKTHLKIRDVFEKPINSKASILIIAHNHPEGKLSPSEEDIKITDKIKKSGEVLGIKLLDYLIFNKNNYYSFKENMLI